MFKIDELGEIDLSNNEIIKGLSFNFNIITDIIKALKIGGEAFVALPFHNKINFISIKTLLLKTCDLKDIIYLPIGIFDKNINFFVLHFIKKLNKPINNNSFQTEIINFYDETKNLINSVNINEIINHNFSFNSSDYIKEYPLNPKHFIIKQLHEVANIEYGDYLGNGNGNGNDNKYKIYGYKNENKKTNKYNKDGFNIIITKFKVYLTDDKLFLNNFAISVKSSNNDIILDKYLGYYISHKYKNINLKILKSFNIHIPPIEVQEEIVNYMNENNENIENLKKEIEELNYKSSLWFMNVD
jgi:restriction endonuclease S subunit